MKKPKVVYTNHQVQKPQCWVKLFQLVMDCSHRQSDSIPMSVSVGDTVLLDGTGFKHKNGGKTYHIFRESELLSVLFENKD